VRLVASDGYETSSHPDLARRDRNMKRPAPSHHSIRATRVKAGDVHASRHGTTVRLRSEGVPCMRRDATPPLNRAG